MKPNLFTPIILICFLFITQGCVEQKAEEISNNVQHIADLTIDNAPQKKWVNFDSLLIYIPGNNEERLPSLTTAEIPKPIELHRISELVPGISNLRQSAKEKREGATPIRSKKPEVIKVDYTKLINQDSKQFEPAIITNISKSVHLSSDNISDYEKVVIENNLITIQHNDTIYPPLSSPAIMPKHTKALPFGHHDYSLFDIRLLDDDQKLQNSFIRAIAKDDKGIIWLGTHNGGLISYDGHVFGQYTKSKGLSSNMVISLLIDSKNNIWIGTEDDGLNLYDGINITRFTKKQGLPSNRIFAILEDAKGNIWIATTGGVSMFDGESFTTYTIKQGLNSNITTSLYEDNKGNIWVGTYGGITKYNPNIEQNELGMQKLTTFTEKDGLTSDKVFSIEQDNSGNMWFGTNGGGVSMFDGDVFVNYSTEQGLGNSIILSIIEDSYNNLWFGTYGNGVTRFNGKSFSHYTTKEGLSDNYVRTLFDDNEGNLWIGTDGNGISSFIINSFTNFTTEQGLSNNLALSIFQDEKNRMWFGMFEGGVIIYNKPVVMGQNGTFTHITTEQGLADNTVVSIIMDSNGNYWFGTYHGGASMLDGNMLKAGKLKFTNYSMGRGLNNNIVRCVLQDNSENIWFGTEGGATKFDGEKFVTITKKDGLGSNKISTIYQDTYGAIWFGTINGGVSRFKDDTLTRYTKDQGLGNNTVWTITQDRNGLMWFGTDGGGLTCFNGESFRTFNTDNGLSNNHVYSLIIDDYNSLWVGTTRGLNQIKLTDTPLLDNESLADFYPAIVNYGKMDGLKNIDFFTNAAFADKQNRLWWGTSDALSMLNLNKYKSNNEAPIININKVLINNESIDFSKLKTNTKEYSLAGISFSDIVPFSNIPTNLILPYNLNQLAFRFSATDWSSPNQIRFQYKLHGYEKEWSLSAKNNMVDYKNIPSGKYVFMVRAIGKSNIWSKVIEYPFIIRAPFWLTWWSICIYVVIFAILIWLIIRWRVSIVINQKNILENLIHDRTRELDNSRKLAEQASIAKSQFVATMSHEIRTPLNAIMGLTLLAKDASPNAKQEDYLQKIDRSANTLLSLINDILDFSKIEAGKMTLAKINFDLEIVINSLIVLNSQQASKKELDFVININPLVPKSLIGDPLRIGQVITNLVNNAIKFTASGEVIVNIDIGEKISENEVFLKVEVIDTGIGIEKNNISFLFEEFNQGDSSITRNFGGTGLGLAISKTLIELMNGNISVKSEVGRGSSFYFDVIVGVQSWETVNSQIIPEELKSFNILVCDNNPAALESIVSIIKSFSLNVDIATSGEDAINKLIKKPYELLLINQNQVGLSGIDTIISIQNNADIFPLKMILICDAQHCQDNFRKIKVDGVLSKPNIPSVIIETILSVFGMGKPIIKKLHNGGSKQIQESMLGCKVLLAEDNEINVQLVYELLDRIGINIEIVNNGEDAVKKVKESKYDLVLMDLHMPIMDGYGASTSIRKFDEKIPIIAITADTRSNLMTKCKLAGINDIITKPINPKLMYSTISKWISPSKLTVKNINNLNKDGNAHLNDVIITGLDSELGLKRFAGNMKLYRSMLNKFILSYENTCSELRKMVQHNDFEQAHLIIHSLKGESGNIGVTKVYELSKLVEIAIINKDLVEIERELTLLDVSLANIIAAIRENTQQLDDYSKADNKLIKKLVIKLIGYLESKNPKAFNVLDELIPAGLDKDKFEAINKAVNTEDIEKAVSLLNKL